MGNHWIGGHSDLPAYAEGYEACRLGRKMADNPYKRFTPDYKAWRSGFFFYVGLRSRTLRVATPKQGTHP